MAQKTITIPNELLAEFVEGCELVYPQDTAEKLNPAQWANQCLIDFVKGVVVQGREKKILRAVDSKTGIISVN